MLYKNSSLRYMLNSVSFEQVSPSTHQGNNTHHHMLGVIKQRVNKVETQSVTFFCRGTQANRSVKLPSIFTQQQTIACFKPTPKCPPVLTGINLHPCPQPWGKSDCCKYSALIFKDPSLILNSDCGHFGQKFHPKPLVLLFISPQEPNQYTFLSQLFIPLPSHPKEPNHSTHFHCKPSLSYSLTLQLNNHLCHSNSHYDLTSLLVIQSHSTIQWLSLSFKLTLRSDNPLWYTASPYNLTIKPLCHKISHHDLTTIIVTQTHTTDLTTLSHNFTLWSDNLLCHTL